MTAIIILLLYCSLVQYFIIIRFSSDTEGAAVYYTINGAKPEPFKTIGLAAKSTLLYQEPFVLPPGRRTIKAVAVTRSDISTAHASSTLQIVITRTLSSVLTEHTFSNSKNLCVFVASCELQLLAFLDVDLETKILVSNCSRPPMERPKSH